MIRQRKLISIRGSKNFKYLNSFFSYAQANLSNRFGLAQKNMEKQLSQQEIFTLPAPLSSCSSRNSSPSNLIITSTPISSSKLMTKFSGTSCFIIFPSLRIFRSKFKNFLFATTGLFN